jgi:hypothetical protein|tara:strand:- start:1561 stop:1731 length:171 start_codon:yes stop_codon:yes gene_type:complete
MEQRFSARDSMKKWLFQGKHLHPDIEDDLYIQFMANLFSALTTAVLIGGYHVLVHL